MELFLLLIPGLMIALVVFAAVKVIGRSREVRRAWSSGLTAQARCLRTYTTTSGGGQAAVRTTLHHVYEFWTWDGRVIRFDETNGPSTRVEGDIALVHYSADRPERATAHPPNRSGNAVATGCTLGCLGFVLLFALGFIVAVFSIPN
ncbi:DUF3592 domain-containing protein [Streptomyces spongiae]|uniref:DUF3592 domain-containing protein n=1 Tax=Streptomyces spongiae TaxID=565072 RepID=A0A5N8XE95_9ACTN|nr:DUF3592 domain-containing protein [Streptomyces spongiae]MPY57772.1 hypothetical protein [Streptomyces spongiae]